MFKEGNILHQKKEGKKKTKLTKMVEEVSEPHLESSFSRPTRGLWEHTSKARGEISVDPDFDKIKKMVVDSGYDEKYFSLHTHPFSSDILEKMPALSGRQIPLEEAKKEFEESKMAPPAYPSREDVARFVTNKEKRMLVVAQTDPKTGEVAGYYFVTRTKNTPQGPTKEESKSFIKSDDYKKTKEKWIADHPEYKDYVDSIKSFDENLYKTDPETGEEFIDYDLDRMWDDFQRIINAGRLHFKASPSEGYYFKEGLGFLKKKNDEK